MRTQEEIAARIMDPVSVDFLGTQRGEFISRLDWEHARQFLIPEAKEEEWKEPLSREDDAVRKCALDYLAFAWDKANNCRRLSAQRSLDHFRAWFWLLGDEEMLSVLGENHVFYGKPQLVKISEKLGVDWRSLDNGRWHIYEDDDGLIADEALALLEKQGE